MLTDSQFIDYADKLLQRIADRLETLFEDIDVELSEGILNITFKNRDFILNRHNATKEIWFASPLSGASHYHYDKVSEAWLNTRSEENLLHLLSREFSHLSGKDCLL